MRFLQQLVPQLTQNGALCANYKKGYCGLHVHTHLPHSPWFLASLPHSKREKLTRQSHQNAAVSHASSLCSLLSSSTFSLSLALGVFKPARWICLSVSTHRLHPSRLHLVDCNCSLTKRKMNTWASLTWAEDEILVWCSCFCRAFCLIFMMDFDL